MTSIGVAPDNYENPNWGIPQGASKEFYSGQLETETRASNLEGDSVGGVDFPSTDPSAVRGQVGVPNVSVALQPNESSGHGKHGQSTSDAWSPKTVVIHDASDASSSDKEDDDGGEDDEDEQYVEGLSVDDRTIHIPDEEFSHSEVTGGRHNDIKSAEDGNGSDFSASQPHTQSEIPGIDKSMSSDEPLPVSMHIPCKKSLSSESTGGSGGQMLDWSGRDHSAREHTSMTSVPEDIPVIGGSRESFEAETDNKQPTTAELLVLAQEVQRLENELASSKSEVVALKELLAVNSNKTADESAGPSGGTDDKNQGDEPGRKACLAQRLDFVHNRLIRDEDKSKHAYLQARLLRAERCVEIEREKASRIELEYKVDRKTVDEGEKALQQMREVKQELHAAKLKVANLETAYNVEQNRVELLKAQLSNLISAGATQAEDTQRMHHGFEGAVKETNQARTNLAELKARYDGLIVEARDATARADVSEKLAMDARNECNLLQQQLEIVLKEKTDLAMTVREQSAQIERLIASPVSGPQRPIEGHGENSRQDASPHKTAAHQGVQNLPSLPDPPSAEALLDGSRVPSSDHNLELLVLAQEVERLEQELKLEKQARTGLAAELTLLKGNSKDSLQTGLEALKKENKESSLDMLGRSHDRRTSGVGADVIAPESPSPIQVSSEVTVVEPVASEHGRQSGWSRGLWGFLAGSDLAQD